jgi:transcriptional regulator NrdR family protein
VKTWFPKFVFSNGSTCGRYSEGEKKKEVCGICGRVFANVHRVPSHYKMHIKREDAEENLKAERLLCQFQQAIRDRKEAAKTGWPARDDEGDKAAAGHLGGDHGRGTLASRAAAARAAKAANAEKLKEVCGICGVVFYAVQGVPSHYKMHIKRGDAEKLMAERLLCQFQQAIRDRKEAIRDDEEDEDFEEQSPGPGNAPLVLDPSARNCSQCSSRPFASQVELISHMWDEHGVLAVGAADRAAMGGGGH